MATTNPDDPTDPWDPALAAEQYAALGWCVIPIAPGKKYPPVPQWQDAATDNLDVIRSWWTGLYRGHGVGIATGSHSGFWVLDIDISDGKPGDENLAILLDRHGPLPLTVEAETGSGGGHLLFRWDPARPITNGYSSAFRQLDYLRYIEVPNAKDPTLPPTRYYGLDIRGAGGQIVAAPTIHPNGAPYRWIEGRDPWQAPLADAPDWLYDILLPPPPAPGPAPALDTAPRSGIPAGGQPASVPGRDVGGPADWMRAGWDWAAELQAAGWLWHSDHGPDSWWTRPGKNPRDGHSAVLHQAGAGPLVVFSTEADPTLWASGTPTTDGSGVSVTPFDFATATRFRGDHQEAGRVLRAELHPDPHPRAPFGGGVPAPVATVGTTPEDPWPSFGVWTPADLSTYLTPGWEPEPPTLLERADGRALFYRANVNWLHGASGEGKTWVAIITAAQEILAGRHVLWIHYEDPLPDKLANRLTLLGVPAEAIVDRFHVCCIGGASMVQGLPFARAIAAHYQTDLVVVDSVGEAIGSDGVAVKDDERFVAWLHATARQFAGDGRTFLGIDHLPMGEPGRLDPVGSFRKKAAVTGSMFLAESPNPPARGRRGYIRLTCAKDRSGVWTKGEVAALVHMAPAGDLIDWSVGIPRADVQVAGEPEAIVLGRHAARAVTRAGRPLSQRGVLAAMTEVHGRTEAKRRGLEFAVLQGWLVEMDGPRGARMFDVGPVDIPSPGELLEGWEDHDRP